MVVLVTGASAGIGKATAKRLLAAEHTVYVAARRVEKMQDLAALGAHVLKMDITQKVQVESGLQAITKTHGGVDALVNNAGFALHGAVEDVPIEKAKSEFDVNVFGAMHLANLCIPYMRQQGFGRIINVSSIGGKIFAPMTGWYFSSKYALEGISKCLRLEVKPFGIDVVVINPGLISTEITDITVEHLNANSAKGKYKALAKMVGDMMLGYKPIESNPDVVAKAIARAIKAKRPKNRYAIGRFAKVSLFMFWLLPERWLTVIYWSIIKQILNKKMRKRKHGQK